MSLRRSFLLVLPALALALACNAVSGIGDVVAEDPIDAGLESGAALEDGEAADTGAVPAPPPTCTCVAPAPADWTGPIALLESADDTPRTCPTGLTALATGGSDLTPGPDCQPCTCGAPTGTCTTAMATIFTGTMCVTPCMNVRPITTTCTPQPYCATQSSGNATLVRDGGSCAPSAGGVRPRPWTKSATSCGFTSPFSDCPSGLACAPRSAGAPDARTCIMKTGEHACPTGSPYSLRNLSYGKLTDTRSCTACTCGTPNVTCTNATVTFYNDSNCQDVADSWSTSGSCDSIVTFNDVTGSAKITEPSTITGSCAASGGNASGSITPEEPTTYCCLP